MRVPLITSRLIVMNDKQMLFLHQMYNYDQISISSPSSLQRHSISVLGHFICGLSRISHCRSCLGMGSSKMLLTNSLNTLSRHGLTARLGNLIRHLLVIILLDRRLRVHEGKQQNFLDAVVVRQEHD